MTSRLATAALIGAASLSMSLGSAHAASLTEGFDVVPLAGWTTQNNSTATGSTGWFQGNLDVFSAFEGAADSYIGANFNNEASFGTISNWLITPTLSFNNGDEVAFYTRTVDTVAFPDRLELRFSSVGGTDVGSTPDSVGTFSLLLSVNPDLTLDGYPNVWTQYSATISGLSGPTDGALAFRYFITAGGPFGDNSDFIGIDSFSVTAVPEPGTWLLMALGLGAFALRQQRAAHRG
jgi:hypothetical protein